MKWYLLVSVVLAGIFYHTLFFSYNTILTEADSYAYIRMAEWILRLSSDGLGTGWFGFIYSAFLAVFLLFFEFDILAGQITNMFLLAISSMLFYHIARKIFSVYWSLFALALFLFHPSFLYYRIHLLAENIYIPIFLWLVLVLWKYMDILRENKEIRQKNTLLSENNTMSNTYAYPLLLWIFLGLLYLTRAEGFIYMGSIGIIALFLLWKKHLSFQHFFISGSIFFLSFFICIAPYLFHLHSLTWEWGLTNKWASNWRQAELRGREHMDDLWFEEAVAGLTPDRTWLIAWFAGGTPYFKPQIEGGFISSLREDPTLHIERFWANQIKLYTQNIPEIYFWNSYKLARSEDSRFHSPLFQFFLLLILFPLGIWIIISYKKYSQLLSIFLAFFIPACIFFTLFFTLNRYFIIFLPFILLFTTLWVSQIQIFLSQKIWKYGLLISILFLILFWTNTALSNYNSLSLEWEKNEFYTLKKDVWEWLWVFHAREDIKVLERFPFITYYSWAPWRYITPYSDNIDDIRIYMIHHHIDYLIVDSMDFYSYRPALRKYLEEIPEGFELVREFINSENQRVRIYKLEK